jgi:hypothetical protein
METPAFTAGEDALKTLLALLAVRPSPPQERILPPFLGEKPIRARVSHTKIG